MKSTSENVNSLLSQTRMHLQTLVSRMPALIKHLSGDNISHDSWKILEQIPENLCEVEGRPVITIAFCGPSGAGKSTVFNLLTGIGVPAGGAVRPMTHASLAAFPEELRCRIQPQQVFRGFNLSELAQLSELKKSGIASNQLFFHYFSGKNPAADLWPCLIDIPDFNTTEVANWDKAEEMIRRAESIIFTVYHEAYKDMKTFEILKKVLLIAGNVTILLTKLDPAECAANAAAIRNDLIDSLNKRPDFNIQRTDGQTLATFLQNSAFYYSPFLSDVRLSDIKPLANACNDFSEHIFGQNGPEVALKRQLQSITLGVNWCEKLCAEAEASGMKLRAEIEAVEAAIAAAAQTVTGEEFPVFKMLNLIRRQLEENRPTLLRRAFQPLLLAGSSLKAAISSVSKAISRLSGGELLHNIKQRDSLEKTRLHSEVNNLIESWRRNPKIQGVTTEKCAAATSAILNAELPPVDSEWEISLNESLKKWQSGNKDLWKWLNIIDEVFILLGAGLVFADFFIDGGVGTMGAVAVIGGSGATGGFLLSLFNNMGLGREVVEAHQQWKKLRQASYQAHIKKLLAGPIFLEQLETQAATLSAEQISVCQTACRKLKEISLIHEIR